MSGQGPGGVEALLKHAVPLCGKAGILWTGRGKNRAAHGNGRADAGIPLREKCKKAMRAQEKGRREKKERTPVERAGVFLPRRCFAVTRETAEASISSKTGTGLADVRKMCRNRGGPAKRRPCLPGRQHDFSKS